MGFCRSTSALDAVSAHCTRGPRVQIGLQLMDRTIYLFGTRAIESVEDGLMKALTDAAGLRALGLGAGVIEVLDRQVEFIFVPLRIAAKFASAGRSACAAA